MKTLDLAGIIPAVVTPMDATGAVDEHIDEEGTAVPAKPSTLTLDYSRLVCCLWTANRSMLARLEALEARLQ